MIIKEKYSIQSIKDKKIQHKKIAEEFESLFINMMLKNMRNTIQNDEDSNDKKMYQSMLDSQYAQSISKESDGIGIKKMVLEWLEKHSS